jgi:hypothetical protein
LAKLATSPASKPWVAKINDTVFVKFCSFDAGLGGIGAGDKVVRIGMQADGHSLQFISGVGQRRQRGPEFCDVGNRAADTARDRIGPAAHVIPRRGRWCREASHA